MTTRNYVNNITRFQSEEFRRNILLNIQMRCILFPTPFISDGLKDNQFDHN